MPSIWTYVIIAAILLIAELVYFKIADHFNIIDKPNERSSHSTIVLRGGGVIFAISMLVWFGWQMFQDPSFRFQEYLPFLCGLVLICGISFWDDVHSLPDSVRMGVQILSILLMFWSVGLYTAFDSWVWMVVVAAIALFFCVGATNIINFMDGINGITAGYALAMLVPLALVQGYRFKVLKSLLSRRIWWWPSSECWCSASSTSGPRARRSALRGMWGASA